MASNELGLRDMENFRLYTDDGKVYFLDPDSSEVREITDLNTER